MTLADTVDAGTTARRRRLILAAVMMATFMAAVETTIVATAVPTIIADLGHFTLLSWVFAAYLIAQAVSVPIYGRLADIHGRKPVFFAGAALFLVGSTLCGFARGMLPLIVFRLVQGLGAGGVQPVAYTIVGDIYSPAERARVQGLLSGVFGIAAIVGPSLGAVLVEYASWPVVFWVNLPIGAAAIAMLALLYPEPRQSRRHDVDYLGSVLLMVGGGLLMAALVQGGSLGRPLLDACVIGGCGAVVALVWHERRCAEPMLPLALWRNRVVALGNAGSCAIGAVMIGVSSFLPTYVEGAMGASAIAAGGALGAMSVSWALASFAAARVMIRTSYRQSAMIGGLALVAGNVVLMALTPERGPAWAGVGALVIGIGMGFCNTTFLVSAQAAVGRNERGAATSSNLFMRIVGQTTGAAVFGAVVNAGLLHAALPVGAVDRLMTPALRHDIADLSGLSTALAAAIDKVYWLGALIGLGALLLAAGLPSRLSPVRSAAAD